MVRYRLLWLMSLLVCCASALWAATPAVQPRIDRPLIADNQQFGYAIGTSDNKGLGKNTYQFSYLVKVAATGLVFPHSQTYSSWNASENQQEVTNAATYRAAISINKGPWVLLTWDGVTSKTCACHALILNDPVMRAVKPGDRVYLRTEITVPAGGKWGMNLQARDGDDKNWTQGATNTADDVLTSNNADFSPQIGLFIHSALGLFGTPTEKTVIHPTVVVGDSIAGYVLDAAATVGNSAPIANLAMAGESTRRFWTAGSIRQALFAGCDTMVFQDGVNDLREGATFAQLQSAANKVWEAFRVAGGKHLIVCTATPLSCSTDKWATEAGQTADFDPAQRQRWNDYLRLLSEKDLHLTVTVIDAAAVFESTPNNSLWKPLPKGASSDDGVHPNATGGAALAEGVGPAIKKAILGAQKPDVAP